MIGLPWLGLALAGPYDVCVEGCPFDSLAAAIEAAPAGATLTLGAGTWAENLVFDKSITIQGEAASPPILTNDAGLALGPDDALLRVEGGASPGAVEVLLSDLVVYGVGTRPILVTDAKLSLHRAVVRSVGAPIDGGGARVVRGQLIGSDLAFIGNEANRYGGHIYAVDSNIGFEDTRFADGRALRGGGAIYAIDSTVSLNAARFEDNEGLGDGNPDSGWGGAILAIDSDLFATGTTFTRNRASRGGGVRAVCGTAGRINLTQTHLVANEAEEWGGAIAASNCEVLLDKTYVRDNVAADGGGIATDFHASLQVTGGAWCGNQAGGKGGALFQTGLPDPPVASSWNGLHIADNRAAQGGAAAWFNHVELSVVNSAILDNRSPAAAAAGAVHLGRSHLTLHETLVAWNPTTAISLDDATLTASHNAWWQNLVDYPVGTSTSADVRADPQLRQWSGDGDCRNDDLRHSWYGPLRDGGRPELLDPDGSPRDIGVFGGDLLAPSQFYDNDGDGSVNLYDCAPSDFTIGSGVSEAWYDGVDQDCRGDSDFDQDGDGFEHSSSPTAGLVEPIDCDDEDPLAYPGADEIGGDGIDQDCDGADSLDADGDGFPVGIDCDDSAPDVFPGAPERDADGVDSNCDGLDARPVTLQPRPVCGGSSVSGLAFALMLGWPRRRRG